MSKRAYTRKLPLLYGARPLVCPTIGYYTRFGRVYIDYVYEPRTDNSQIHEYFVIFFGIFLNFLDFFRHFQTFGWILMLNFL